MKKIIVTFLIVCSLFIVSGCTKKEENNEKSDAIRFKEDYESINGESNAAGKEHRTLKIDEDNPYVFIAPSDLIKKIEDKETFYVYFGDKQCPWCRSAIEKSIEVAKKYNIDKIYYINIWDDDHNEILRDTYKLDEKNKPVLDKEGTEEYKKLLEYFDFVLRDYTINTDTGKSVSVGEKRIYAPNYIYVRNGEAIKMVEGYSPLQKDSRDELTSEILEDEERIFSEFFDNK